MLPTLDRPAPPAPGPPAPARLGRILCAYDLSTASRRALDLGLMLSRWHRAEVRVMHVLRAPGPGDAVAAAVREHAGAGTEVVVRAGDPVAGLLEQAAEWRADLLVMGTHGQSGARPWGLGSTADALIRRATGPVLAVPAAAPARAFRHVLAAFDFSGPARRMLEVLAALAGPPSVRLTVLHVLEWFPSAADLCVPEYQLDLTEATRERLSRALQASPLAGRPHQARVTAGVPHREILRLAAEAGADLIALGRHGRRALDRHLPGPTTSHLLRESPCPVLAVNG
ncbi:MAG TPA: universal stress protein [Vicinamibacteria bacterium]